MLAGAPVPSTENDLAAKYPPLDSTKEEGSAQRYCSTGRRVEAKEEVRQTHDLCFFLPRYALT